MTPDDRVELNSTEVSGKVLDGEAIIINVPTGMYYSMSDVGAQVWQLLNHAPTPRELAPLIAAAYATPEEQVVDDVTRVVEELLNENLLLRCSDSALRSPLPESLSIAEGTPYGPPLLNRYSDMADLLALDPPMPMLGELPGTNGTS